MKKQTRPYFNYSRDRACDVCGKVPEVMFETRYLFPKIKCECEQCTSSPKGIHRLTFIHCMLCGPQISDKMQVIIPDRGQVEMQIDPKEKIEYSQWGEDI